MAIVTTAAPPETAADTWSQPTECATRLRAQYRLNFGLLFGPEHSAHAIEQLGDQALARRQAEIQRFDRHLDALLAHYRAARSRAEVPSDPAPLLSGWQHCDLDAIRQQHGGLLVALFHFGPHRQIVADLALLGLPYVAPLAARAYFQCARIAEIASPRVREAMRLIEVESPRVGRHLLQGLRAGRVGLIYVDGNMGPEGHTVDEGAVEVDFLARRIRVKEGIARLAASLQWPVLPLFVLPSPLPSRVCGEVRPGPLLPPPTAADDASRHALMQTLYDQLAERVQTEPAAWEYACCLHRWLRSDASLSGPGAAMRTAPARLRVAPECVGVVNRDPHDIWVDLASQRAFRLPAWARGLHRRLCEGATFDDAMAWLCRRDSDPQSAQQLLLGLHRRGLILDT